jgi:hypothetical protein
MNIKADFKNVAERLNKGIVGQNIAIPQLISPSYNQGFLALANEFHTLAAKYDIATEVQEVDLCLPIFRHAIQGLSDTIENEAFNDDAVKFYVQSVSDQLAAHGAAPKL